MSLFSGKQPTDLGVRDGRFTARPTWKPNWVSSQADTSDAHYVAPLKFTREPAAVMARLQKIIKARPRTAVVRAESGYLYAQFRTALMGYVDDVEFACGNGEIHVRSSSRLGIRDFDVNRKRVEAIRKEFQKNA